MSRRKVTTTETLRSDPYVTIEGRGRFSYKLTLRHEIVEKIDVWGEPEQGYWFKVGRGRAERSAKRQLRLYNKRYAHEQFKLEVRSSNS